MTDPTCESLYRVTGPGANPSLTETFESCASHLYKDRLFAAYTWPTRLGATK